MYDLVIRNGLIVDGTGAPAFAGDVAVQDGRIAAVAPHIDEQGREEIDAHGKCVAPGFIDVHTHSDGRIFDDTVTGWNHLEAGTTTELVGQCGSQVVPWYEGLLERNSRDMNEAEYREICSSFHNFMAYAQTRSLGTNIAVMAGQGNIRGKVMGLGAGLPDERQTAQMRDIMTEAMEAGCIGFSTGLVYTPSVFAGPDEITEIARAAHAKGGVYTSHIRGEGNSLVASIEEALDVGRKTGIPVNISHIKVIGKQNEGKSKDVIAIIEKAQAGGMRVTADLYPFTGGSAPLASQLPPKYLTEGIAESVKKLSDPALRKQILWSIMNEPDEFESNIYSAGFDGTLLCGCAATPQYVGKTLGQIGREEGRDPFDVCCDILMQNNGVAQGIYMSQNESDMLRFLAQPWVMSGSDWSDGSEPVDPETVAGSHPRGLSTMTRRLELIREHHIEGLESAVHRLTGMPADVYDLPQIGRLQPGKKADITIFEWDKVRAHADFIHPFRRNEGIDTVIVSGKVAVKDGRFTGSRCGKVLKKGE